MQLTGQFQGGGRRVKDWVVLKFGGTSVSTPERWATIAGLVERRLGEGLRPLVVCSALSGISDQLEELADLAVGGRHEEGLAAIWARHLELGAGLGIDAACLLQVDFDERRVTAGGNDVELTPLEFRLLTAFVDHPNQLLQHDQLLELVWGGERGSSRDQVKLYVGYLRRKLGAAGVEPDAIETVRGYGYRYSPS